MATPAELLEWYATGPAKLRATIAGMTDAQLRAKPIAGKLSTWDVVIHIADFEPVFADRIRRVISLKKPLLLAADENDYLAHLGYESRDLNEELELIDACRKTTTRILRGIAEEAWERPGIHNEKGLITLAQLVKSCAGHITHHLKFIEEKKAALGLS